MVGEYSVAVGLVDVYDSELDPSSRGIISCPSCLEQTIFYQIRTFHLDIYNKPSFVTTLTWGIHRHDHQQECVPLVPLVSTLTTPFDFPRKKETHISIVFWH